VVAVWDRALHDEMSEKVDLMRRMHEARYVTQVLHSREYERHHSFCLEGESDHGFQVVAFALCSVRNTSIKHQKLPSLSDELNMANSDLGKSRSKHAGYYMNCNCVQLF
jgi:hypothetical protein